MAKTFRELVPRTGNAKTKRIAARRTQELLAEMVLSEIREALGKTQTQMARAAGMKQPSWARLEGQSDMLISTLRKVMKAMGDAEIEAAVRAELAWLLERRQASERAAAEDTVSGRLRQAVKAMRHSLRAGLPGHGHSVRATRRLHGRRPAGA